MPTSNALPKRDSECHLSTPYDDAESRRLVDASAARDRIQNWISNGLTMNRIARITGVADTSLSRILYGQPAHGIAPRSNISASTNASILSEDALSEMMAYYVTKIDATGTVRRVRALSSIGYSKKIICEESGIRRETFDALGNCTKVKADDANAIKEAYERLRNVSPPMETPAEKGLVSKTMANARKNGWLPPLAWDDATMDDPRQRPSVRKSPPAPEVIRECACKTVKHEHGTRNAYLTDKCRCLPCKEAHRVANNHNRRMTAYGHSRTFMVDAKPAQKHVKNLLRRGWGVENIAKNSGVSKSTISRLLYGEPAKNAPPPVMVLASTSDSILGFAPTGKRNRHEGTVLESVDATGTKRRVQALVACGYSMAFLAKEFGASRQIMTKLIQGDRVLLTKAESFKTIYDRLWDKEPPRTTAAQKKAYTTAKKMAQENGWPPPMAWDDDAIDNPRHKAAA